jgi:RimJ/RimL family protein N-acetyltransferase
MTEQHLGLAVPVLETERLILRGHTLDDYPDSAALWAHSLVTQHIGGRPSTAEDSWRRLLQFAGLWAALGFGYWLIQEREGGRFVGEAGFGDFHRDVEPSFHGVPEAGWALAPWSHGRGYATEAVRAIHAWIDGRHPRTVCIIAPENAASIGVALKCGYREIARTTYKEGPTLLFERLSASRTTG